MRKLWREGGLEWSMFVQTSLHNFLKLYSLDWLGFEHEEEDEDKENLVGNAVKIRKKVPMKKCK